MIFGLSFEVKYLFVRNSGS